jgi:hypothetical protein
MFCVLVEVSSSGVEVTNLTTTIPDNGVEDALCQASGRWCLSPRSSCVGGVVAHAQHGGGSRLCHLLRLGVLVPTPQFFRDLLYYFEIHVFL